MANLGAAKLYAYQLSDGTRDAGRDFDTLAAAGNTTPAGIWSDRTTLWVADWIDDKLYAYHLSDGMRAAGRDITLAAANTQPGDIWSDGTTLWVTDSGAAKLYAYQLSDGTRDADQDFDTLAAGNTHPGSIWSNGTTLWVADFDTKVYAYRLSDQARDSGKDFDTLDAAGNETPLGIWSDGTTLWVVDSDDDKVYAYNMPPPPITGATETRLRSLTLSGVALVPEFDSDVFDYAGSVPGGTTHTTVTPVTLDPNATAVIKVDGVVDADGTVGLAVGANEITVEVTAEDGTTMRTYTVTVTVTVTDYLTPRACGNGKLPADTSTTGVIVVPEIIRHGAGRCYSEIDTPGDVDWISVYLKRGTRYQIELLGAGNAWTAVEGGDPLTLHSPRIRGIYHEDGLGRLLAPPDRIYATDSYDKFLFSMVPVAASGSVEAYVPPESGTFYVEVRAASAQATGTYALQVFDLSAPIENAPPDWPKASVSEPSGGDLTADGTTTGFPGRGDATGRRTSGDTDWFKMELYPGPGLADVDVLITTNKRVTGSMKLRSIIRQTFASDIGHGDEFLLSLRNYDGGTVYVEVGVFGYEDEVFNYTLTMLPVSRQQQMDAPERPQGLTGSVVHNAVSLTWDDPKDASITGYQILRRNRAVDAPGQFQVHVDDTGSAEASYVDTEVAPETRYVYRIKARNAAGLSARSKYFNANTPPAPDPAPNNPATGAPIIKGTAEVGETLTADTSGIGDADGLSDAVFSYQWIISLGAGSADIPGATDATYTPAASDEGVAIRVRVSFTDDAGNDESLTSAATASVVARPNTPATGSPTISGTAQVGETLTAETSGITDTDGLTNVAYSYQWLAADSDIAGATSSSYPLADADEGKTIRVKVSFTDDDENPESLTSVATEAVQPKANSPATGQPTISGTAQVGETLTADTSGIADADGLDTAAFSYQWIAERVEISGATGSTYIPTDSDEGQGVKVRVSFTDDAGNEESLTSGATVAVMAAEPEPEPEEPPAQPTGLSGTASHDEVSLSWDYPEDDSITGYQILRRNPAVDAPGQFQVHVDDTGSAATTYVDREVEPDTGYVYRIKARSAAGLSERSDYFRADTPPEPEPEPEPNNPATGGPTISGTARVGETLTADTSGIADADGLDNATFGYQWVATDGGADLDIRGATKATYTLLSIDAALRFKVRVSFTDDAGNKETLTSEVTAVVVSAEQ